MKNKEKITKNKEDLETGLIAIIRISGLVNMNYNFENTLDRLRLRRKYSCVLIKPNKTNKGMLNKIKNFVAYGNINEKTLEKLIKERARLPGNKKINKDEREIAKKLIEGKTMQELGLKPFFRLSPPKGGINSKKHYPKGVLGDHKQDINKLIERML